MPQKKNPDSLELIRGKCGRVFGDLNVAVHHHEGPAHDLQSRHAGGQGAAVRRRRSGVAARSKWRHVVVETTQSATRALPLAAAEESWVVATDLAEALARTGTPFHQAHQIVGRLVLESVRGGKKPSDWTAESLTAFAPEFTPECAAVLTPSEGMRTREIAGGTGPDQVKAALAAAATRLKQLHA